jgi:hypothetical protein
MTQQTATIIGCQRTAAMMLSLPWHGGIVSRATVRAALPGGATAKSALSKLLRDCQANGNASVGTLFVRVLAPHLLRLHALRDLPGEPTLSDFVDVLAVAGKIRHQIASEPNPAVRRLRQAEVEFLESLR